MLRFFADLITFILPALMVNVSPFLVSRIFGFDIPVDLCLINQEKRLIGDTRSMGGLILSLAVTLFVSHFYADPLAVVAMGIGAILGTHINSLLKRFLQIAEGRGLPIIDQLDFVAGGLIGYSAISPAPYQMVLASLSLAGFIHLFVNIFVRPYFER